MIPDTLSGLTVAVSDLQPYGQNPRRGNVSAIAESLTVNGQYRPIVVRRGSNEVLAGNHTLAAALTLGWTEIAATYVDVDDEGARRIVLADNRTNDLSSYDDGALAELLHSLEDLDGTGWSEEEMLALTPSFDPIEADEQPRLDQRNSSTCPSCGFEWRIGAAGEVEPT